MADLLDNMLVRRKALKRDLALFREIACALVRTAAGPQSRVFVFSFSNSTVCGMN